jgi:hypothetical protein
MDTSPGKMPAVINDLWVGTTGRRVAEPRITKPRIGGLTKGGVEPISTTHGELMTKRGLKL